MPKGISGALPPSRVIPPPEVREEGGQEPIGRQAKKTFVGRGVELKDRSQSTRSPGVSAGHWRNRLADVGSSRARRPLGESIDVGRPASGRTDSPVEGTPPEFKRSSGVSTGRWRSQLADVGSKRARHPTGEAGQPTPERTDAQPGTTPRAQLSQPSPTQVDDAKLQQASENAQQVSNSRIRTFGSATLRLISGHFKRASPPQARAPETSAATASPPKAVNPFDAMQPPATELNATVAVGVASSIYTASTSVPDAKADLEGMSSHELADKMTSLQLTNGVLRRVTTGLTGLGTLGNPSFASAVVGQNPGLSPAHAEACVERMSVAGKVATSVLQAKYDGESKFVLFGTPRGNPYVEISGKAGFDDAKDQDVRAWLREGVDIFEQASSLAIDSALGKESTVDSEALLRRAEAFGGAVQ